MVFQTVAWQQQLVSTTSTAAHLHLLVEARQGWAHLPQEESTCSLAQNKVGGYVAELPRQRLQAGEHRVLFLAGRNEDVGSGLPRGQRLGGGLDDFWPISRGRAIRLRRTSIDGLRYRLLYSLNALRSWLLKLGGSWWSCWRRCQSRVGAGKRSQEIRISTKIVVRHGCARVYSIVLSSSRGCEAEN